MSDGAFQRIKARIYCKTSGILLAALLTIAISIFVYTLSAQAKQEVRLRQVETVAVLNAQTLTSVKEALEKGDSVLGDKIDAAMSVTNRRFDTLEQLLLAISGKTGGK